ncbi:hypothetical protein GQX73_g2129 [Xylaria multiplex]|uniref:Uncharacterized protein n=1 Tax=Xylaria multiplex TaxID=323545 RepID=A0A7C8NBI9_9PEZI|nr:hypothetical protein GQX73_g2129 [Xylaria multiplex]
MLYAGLSPQVNESNNGTYMWPWGRNLPPARPDVVQAVAEGKATQFWKWDVFPLPDGISFTDAATLNTVYSTALYALTEVAKVQPGQSILTYSTAGGLGIAALRLCNHLGAGMCDGGNNKKRQFLIDKYNTRPDRVFYSRSADFAITLMEKTDGTGVDIALNTLTGQILHVSWDCIEIRGVFLELVKKDISRKSGIFMEPFQRNAKYRGVDMSHELLERIFTLIQKGYIEPVIGKVFGFGEFREAFRLLSTGDIIRNTVITRGASLNATVPIYPLPKKTSIRSNRSYVIIGDLRGIYGSLAIYFAKQGAKSPVAFARSGYDDPTSQKIAKTISGLGTELTLVIGGVTNKDVDKISDKAPKPVAGIIHGAMVLRDKMHNSMKKPEFRVAVAPKVQGWCNLHNSSIRRKAKLDFFILFSSIRSVVGQKS